MLPKGRIIKRSDNKLFPMPSFPSREHAAHGRGRTSQPRLSQEQETAEIEREAYEAGFATGERAGREMGERKAAVLLSRFEQLLAAFEGLNEQIIKEVEPKAIRLSVAIARKIIGEELALRPEVIANIVKEALKKLDRTGTVRIRISPAMEELFVRLRPELLEAHPDIIFEVDPTVSSTGTVVTSAHEEVPTDIDEQLRQIFSCMKDAGV